MFLSISICCSIEAPRCCSAVYIIDVSVSMRVTAQRSSCVCVICSEAVFRLQLFHIFHAHDISTVLGR